MPVQPSPFKVSVLMPTYNYARFLPLAIESVLAQVLVDFELLISDDASTDDSEAIARDYAAKDPRVRVCRHAVNLGMVANWNWCLRQARGHYVKFLFGDDALAAPDTLHSLTACLDHHPTAVLAGSARLILDADSQPTGVWDDLKPGLHPGAALAARCLRRRRNLIGEPTSIIFRRTAAARGFDATYRQIVDLEMWFHLLRRGDFVYTERPLCAFRRHAGQQTAVNNRARVTDREMGDLLDRYVGTGGLRAQVKAGGFAHRMILYRQAHYMRKACARHPDSLAIQAGLRRQIGTAWLPACWISHRLSRPVENFTRKFRSWSIHLGLRRGAASPDRGMEFLSGLPAGPRLAHRISNPFAAPSWMEAMRHPFPQAVASVMLLAGVTSSLWMLAILAREQAPGSGPRPPPAHVAVAWPAQTLPPPPRLAGHQPPFRHGPGWPPPGFQRVGRE